jgi:dUTP pyrophosphatase
MKQTELRVIYLDTYNGGENDTKLCYAKEGDSGFDLRASTNEAGGYSVAPRGVIVVPVGIKVATPKGTELQVRTRSGSPLKKGFNVANSPGTVDSGYRGEVGVLCYNLSDEIVEIECGERIAQGVICPVYQANFIEVDELDETERGEGAYNSTGVQ